MGWNGLIAVTQERSFPNENMSQFDAKFLSDSR